MGVCILTCVMDKFGFQFVLCCTLSTEIILALFVCFLTLLFNQLTFAGLSVIGY